MTTSTTEHLLDWYYATQRHVGDFEIAKAKIQLLDFIAVTTAARADSVIGAAPLVQSTPELRAFDLAALGHHLDYDDTYQRAQVHPSVEVWPALLVSGIRSGTPLLQYYALCTELFNRLAEAVILQTRWFITQLLGAVASAFAYSVAREQPARTTERALGLAVMQASGTKLPARTTGSLARRIYPAFGVHAGVFAGRLAELGVDGPIEWLNGPVGLGEAYLDDPSYAGRVQSQFRESGFRTLQAVEPKRWPSCSLTHPYIEMIRLLQTDGGREVPSEVIIWATEVEDTILVPYEQRIKPPTIVDAKYSLPFVVSMALHSDARLNDWRSDVLRDESILNTAAAIKVVKGKERGIRITDQAGNTRHITEHDLISPWDHTQEVFRKLGECFEVAGVPETAASDLISEVMSLDGCTDLESTSAFQYLFGTNSLLLGESQVPTL